METIKTLDDRIEAVHQATVTVADQLAMSRQEVAELRAVMAVESAALADSVRHVGSLKERLAKQAKAAPVGAAPQPIEDQSDLSKAILTATYRCCQRGDSPERLHAAVMEVFAHRAALASQVEAVPVAGKEYAAGRQQGRAEALSILLQLDPENGIDEYTGWSTPAGPEDEGAAYWDAPKLRELFAADGALADMLDKAEGEYWHYKGLQDEAEHAKNFAANMHSSGKVREILSKAGEFDLMGQLCSTAPPAAAKVAPPEFSHDPDGDLALEWVVGDASLSVSFSKTGMVSWAANVAGKSDSGSRQVAQDSGATVLSRDARECLMDVVSHHSDFLMACNVTRDLRLSENDRGSASHWKEQANVLIRMKLQAERALAAPPAAAKVAQDSGRDAALLKQRIIEITSGIDRDECEDDSGWWETVAGSKFGKEKLAEILAAIDAAMAAQQGEKGGA